jgi:hypothetical protein
MVIRHPALCEGLNGPRSEVISSEVVSSALDGVGVDAADLAR